MKKDKKKTEQINRINRYEECFDRIGTAVKKLGEALDGFDSIQPELKELTEYYESDTWKKDFEDDEKGLIPKDIKRGVLSEDGVYDLLETIKDLKERIKC